MTSQQTLRAFVRGAYALQKQRIQTGNRICANFKAKLGQAPGQSEETLDPESKKILAQIRALNDKLASALVQEVDDETENEFEEESKPGVPKPSAAETKSLGLVSELIQRRYKLITEGKKNIPSKSKFIGDAVISNYAEFCLIQNYFDLEKQENQQFARLAGIVEDFPIYTEWLKDVQGCGHIMSGVIISEIEIEKAKYASSLWKLAGLGVEPDGKGTSRRAEHLVKVKYTDAQGKEAERDSITFKPFLKTKLIGVLATSFQRTNSPYLQEYWNYLRRIENMYVHATWRLESGSNPKGFPTLIAGIWQHKKTGELVFQKPAKIAKPEPTADNPKPKAPASPWTELKKLPESSVSGDGKTTPKIMTLGDTVWSYGKSRGHRHRMAMRYMIKQFLAALYLNWKRIAGLPVMPSYAEAKLGLKHGQMPDAGPAQGQKKDDAAA